jgi:glutathione S-transferase
MSKCHSAAAPDLTLFLAPGSSSMAPHIALHELGVAFEARPLSLARKENRAPAFLAINPEGKVPVLLVDGVKLTEVAAILFYLARRFPAGGLLPQGDLAAEAQAISWMSFLASAVHPARRQGLEPAVAAWRLAEQRLGGRDWALGAACSIADIHLFRLFWRFRGGAPAEAAAFPALLAHHARMMARPAVARTIAAEAAIGYEIRP